jgi:cobalamin transport system substrate-binding protein
MNKWRWLLLILSCWMGAGFAVSYALQSQQDQATPLPARADRIVSMTPNLTEILFALGLDEQIVAVTQYSNYPAAAKEKPKVGSFWQPDIEAVVAAKPSLVVLLGFAQQKNLAERLKRIGYRTLTVKIETVNEFFKAAAEIGAATARQRQAEELIATIKKKLQALSRLLGNEPRVRVLWVVQREPLRVAGRDTFVNEMIELAGGENAIGPTLHKYPPIGAEQVIISRPDVIIEPDMGRDDLTAQRQAALRYWSRFKNVPAVRNGRVYVIDGDTVSRLGPRLYEGVELVARCLRPELFKK